MHGDLPADVAAQAKTLDASLSKDWRRGPRPAAASAVDLAALRLPRPTH